MDLSALEEADLLGVLHDAGELLPRVEQREAQKLAGGYRRAVVGEEYRARLRHLLHLADLFAFAVLAHAARRQDTRGLGRRPVAYDIFDERRFGDRGLRIRHRYERRKSARGARVRSAVKILVPLAAGIAEVRVKVDEAGGQQTAAALDDLRPFAGERRPDLRDPALFDEKTVVLYEFLAIEYFKTLKKNLFHYLAPPPQR